MLQSPGTLHKDVGGAGTKVSGKTVGGVGTATLTTLSSINNTSNATRNKNNPVSHEVRNETREFCKSQRRLCSNRSRYIILGQESCRPRTLNSDKRLSIINRFSMLIYHRRNAYSPSRCIGTRSDYPAPFFSFFVLSFLFSFSQFFSFIVYVCVTPIRVPVARRCPLAHSLTRELYKFTRYFIFHDLKIFASIGILTTV